MKPFFYTFEKYPYHVSGKCPHGQWPELRLDQVWDVFVKNLNMFHQHYRLKTHSFVLMSNHYHWICSREKSDKQEPIETLFDTFHQSLNFDFKVIKPSLKNIDVFKREPKAILLDHIEAYRNAYHYVYRNPIEAGLVKNILNYQYSTLPYVMGVYPKTLPFPVYDNMNLIQNPFYVLQNIQRFKDASSEAD